MYLIKFKLNANEKEHEGQIKVRAEDVRGAISIVEAGLQMWGAIITSVTPTENATQRCVDTAKPDSDLIPNAPPEGICESLPEGFFYLGRGPLLEPLSEPSPDLRVYDEFNAKWDGPAFGGNPRYYAVRKSSPIASRFGVYE